MKQSLTTVLIVIIFLIISLSTLALLSMALRGQFGNPSETQLLSDSWKKNGPFELSPESGRFAITYALYENKKFDFDQSLAKFVLPDLGVSRGKFVSLFPSGESIIALPFYALGKSVGLAQVGTFSVSLIFTFFNFLLILLIVKKLTRNLFAAVAAALTFTFATNAFAYAGSLYEHHLTLFFLLLGFYLVLFRRNLVLTFIVGILVGLGVFVEYQSILFFAPIIIWLLSKYITVTEVEKKLKATISFSFIFIVIGLLLGLLPLFWYNQNAYNNPLEIAGTLSGIRALDDSTNVASQSGSLVIPSNHYGSKKSLFDFFNPTHLPNSVTVLVTSTERGVIVFSPVILLGLLGFWALNKKIRGAAYTLAGVVSLVFVLYFLWGDPWGGWAFGPRYLIPAFGFLAIGIGVAIDTYGRNILFGLVFWLLFLYSLAINIAGALTSLAIAPSVEVDAQTLPKITYLHNFSEISKSQSSSFIYNTYLQQHFSLTEISIVIFIVVCSLMLASYICATSHD